MPVLKQLFNLTKIYLRPGTRMQGTFSIRNGLKLVIYFIAIAF
jgi:hypothetical protein